MTFDCVLTHRFCVHCQTQAVLYIEAILLEAGELQQVLYGGAARVVAMSLQHALPRRDGLSGLW